MSLVAHSLAGLVLDGAHPTPDPTHCINHRQLRTRCTACVDLCPAQCFTSPGTVPDWTACTNCGLCVSACSARCIAPSEPALEQQLKPLMNPPAQLWLGCTAAKRASDCTVDCLAALPWEYLAALSLNTLLVLDLAPCADCKRPCAALMIENLNHLIHYWGTDFTLHILPDYSGDARPEPPARIERRSRLMAALSNGQKTLGRLAAQLPGFTQEKRNGLLYRLLLHTKMQQNPEANHSWPIPQFTAACWGCGICETLCVQKALRFLPQSDGGITVAFSPWKCTDCGLCAALCPENAILPSRPVPLADLDSVAIYHIRPVLCKSCGRRIRPGAPQGVCPICLQKLKRRQQRPPR